MKFTKLIPVSFVCTIVYLVFCQAVFSQSESLGIVRYTPVKGWTKTPKENIVAFSELSEKTGRFCIITLYGATPGSGSSDGDFSREWRNLVGTPFKAESPQTDVQTADGWTITAGGAPVEAETGKSLAFLTVISGSGKTVSILAVFNDQAYVSQVDAFIKGIDMDTASVTANNPAAAGPAYVNGKLIIPPPSRQLTIGDLVGEWGEDAQRISTTYVHRDSGNYAGADSLAFRSKMAFTRNGGYLNDFFAIRNGQKIIDNTVGTFAINGRVLSIKHKGTAKYVIRGWLELPDMTILRVCGPWFDDDVIPENIFSNPDQGANLNKDWVRKK
ncbi:MAG: hypothetical protein ABI878_09165 [Acidobacteriota bacterium]